MEADLEALIGLYLTRGGKAFLSAQYTISYRDNLGGSCPDFVVLDFASERVVVVEVTSSANVSRFVNSVAEREKRWFQPLSKISPFDELGWPFRFLGFVREGPSQLDKVRQMFKGQHDVHIMAIEKALLQYKYWEDRTSLPLWRYDNV